ncbi:MAG: gamma-glutamyltransferase [Pseudomonadota bacterium]
MTSLDGWRRRSPIDFTCEKAPASGDAVVVTNHPLGTAAGSQMLAAGGNAVDAAVASLFALTVVEPMMVGIAGGGIAHIRLPDGTHHIVDAMSSAPAATHETIFEPVSATPPNHLETVGRKSALGPTAIAVPGNLLGWSKMHAAHGKLPFADLLEPAIRLAERGFAVTHYLSGAIAECAEDMSADPAIAAVFLPNGAPPAFGDTLRQPQYGESLRLIAKDGAAALHGGPLGAALASRIAAGEGWLTEADLTAYEAVVRAPIRGTYRSYEVLGPPPPASSGVHVTQMLNIMENADVAALGFGTPEALRLLVATIATGMRDRAKASGDPAFVDVPVDHLTSKAYARSCFEALGRAGAQAAPFPESADTTHVTVADKDGTIVTATHTINGIFGARIMVPDAGFVPNNYMMNFDPNPGRALSVAPGKRVPTSMAPMIVLRDGQPAFALGLSGGVRIFTSAFQAIVNLIDHGMSLQEAVEAPRLWTDGHDVEIEDGYGEAAAEALGPEARRVPHIGGGMNAIGFGEAGHRTGAACWRADGTVAALGGGLARPGVRFWPGRVPQDKKAS